MSSSPRQFDGRVRQPAHTSAPSMFFDLNAEIDRLDSEQPWQAGHTANTIVKYPDLRIILVALKAGAQLVHHRTIGRISIQCLSGEIRVQTPDRAINVSSGKLLTLDREVPHDVVAISDSTFLLTIAWPREETPALVRTNHERSSGQSAEFSVVRRLSETEASKVISIDSPHGLRELGLDKTLSDTFPCSDALSTIPDPALTVVS